MKRKSPSAQTHSMTVMSSRIWATLFIPGIVSIGTKYFLPEPFRPPPHWQPFSSMLYIFSTGMPCFWMISRRRSKCLLNKLGGECLSALGIQTRGFPSWISGHCRRNHGSNFDWVSSHREPQPSSYGAFAERVGSVREINDPVNKNLLCSGIEAAGWHGPF